jgi:hypothetical protein
MPTISAMSRCHVAKARAAPHHFNRAKDGERRKVPAPRHEFVGSSADALIGLQFVVKTSGPARAAPPPQEMLENAQ